MFHLRMLACLLVTYVSAESSSNLQTVVLKTPAFYQQMDYDEVEDSMNVTVPSAHAAVFKHIDDMTFIQAPHSTEHDDSDRERRNAVVNPDRLWPGGVVPYSISSRFHESEKRMISQAMSHWEEHTCIRFRPKVRTDSHSIFITRGHGCGSFVGCLPRFYQPQGIELGSGCVYFDIIVHELGHAIGFYHEHTRPDRDDHIDVNYDSIIANYENNFRKLREGGSDTLGFGYDHASIMHYSRDAFTRDGSDTIQSKDPSIPVGDARELSPLDIAKANALYNCGPPESWPPLSTVVPPEPELTLPEGTNCGEIIQGTQGRFEAPHYPNYTHNLDCAWVIKVPSGYSVRLEFPASGIQRSSLCRKDYVSIYYGNAVITSNELVKFCDRRQHAYIVYHNLVTVYLHTDPSGGSRPGVSGTFTAIDHNECDNSRCHNCTNLQGGFECQCWDGYYHSAAANTCFDINECAFENGGCHHDCVNSGGSYNCACHEGYALQADKLSCKVDESLLATSDPL